MNTINSENALILIIDIQEKLVNMLKDNAVKVNAAKIAKAAGIMNVPVIITEQYPKGLGYTIDEIKEVLPNAKYIEKTNFSAFNDIKTELDSKNTKQVVILGIETHICVLQTAFDLLNSGCEVFIVNQGVGSRSEEDKTAALQRLCHAGVQVVTTEMVLFELLKSSKHPNFKEVQAIIK